ncbi:hypothetical protein N9B42_02335 [Akkermansiaceae bacterium]|nr:hypothetical protein [Akkermansiaceae bacterium]
MAAETVVIQLKGEDKFSQIYATFNSSTQQIEKQVKNLTQALVLEGNAVGKTTNELELMKLQMMGASKVQLDAVKSAQIFRDKQIALAKSSGAVTQQFRFMRGGLGQVGHQVQDIAVQLQMGQNAMLVFGQQGSQIASLFGPHGAIIGALLAVGAAVATSFIPSMKKSSDETKTLSDRINDLNEELKDITESQRRYLLGQQAIKSAKLKDDLVEDLQALVDLRKGFVAAKASIAAYENSTETAGAEQYALSQAQEEAHETVRTFASRQVELQAAVDTTNQELEESSQAYKDLKDSSAAASREYKKVLNDLKSQVEQLNLSGDALFIYQQQQKGASEADVIAALELHKKIEAHKKATKEVIDGLQAETDERNKLEAQKKRQKEADDKKAKSDAERRLQQVENIRKSHLDETAAISQKYKDQRAIIDLAMKDEGADQAMLAELRAQTQIEEQEALAEHLEAKDKLMQEFFDKETERREKDAEHQKKMEMQKKELALATVGVYGAMADQIAAAMEDGSGAQKAMFLVAKGLAVAEAIINANLAYTKTIGQFGAAGIPMAEAVRASGYVSAGLIAGQAIASFEGGGMTGSGVRSGGMDGKGGRLAMVHPNEKITDLQKGQGSNNVVNVNFSIHANDTKGFDALLNSRRGQIISMVNRAVNERGRRLTV